MLRGAEDVRFEVRYECGRALLRVTTANPGIVITHERIIAAVMIEASFQRTFWEGQPPSAFDDEGAKPASIARLLRNRLDRSLHHIFNLLALELDRASIAIAFEALHRGDQPLRGTAFEYLETVLLHDVRDVVWPYLGEERPMRRARDASELLTELRLFSGTKTER